MASADAPLVLLVHANHWARTATAELQRVIDEIEHFLRQARGGG